MPRGVYARKKARKATEPVILSGPASPANITQVQLSVCLPPRGNAAVQIRNGVGKLVGTVLLSQEGLQFRSPRRKILGPILPWGVLDALQTVQAAYAGTS